MRKAARGRRRDLLDDRRHETVQMSTASRERGMVLRDMHIRNVPQCARICCCDKTARESRNSPTYEDNLTVILIVKFISLRCGFIVACSRSRALAAIRMSLPK